jgi:hypothetical protein
VTEMTGDIAGWDMEVAYSEELQREVEELQMTLAAILYEDTDDIDPDLTDKLSGLPYCGCSTCEVREYLFLLVPSIAAALAEGRIIPSPTEPPEEEAHV